jgi:hypothetical protein
LPSKLILASDLTNGIFVLKVDSDLVGNAESKIDFEEVNIYPNPTRGTFHIKGLNRTEQSIEIMILDVLGNELLSLNHTNHEEIDLNHLKEGVYFLVIKSGNAIASKKLIKSE